MNITVPRLSSSLEKALGRALKSFERACNNFSNSLTIVGYGLAAYFVLSGVSKIMEARNNTKSICDDNDITKQQKRNKKKNKKKDKGDGESGDGKEEEESEAKDRDLAPSPVGFNPDLPPDRTAYYAKYSTQIQEGPNARDNTPSYANIYNIPP